MNADTDLDLNLLRYLVLLVEEASVSRTAERLDVTQSAVSAALRRLRVTFNDPILVRSGQAMVATARAVEMAARVAPMLSDVAQMTKPLGPYNPAMARQTFTIMGSDYVEFIVTPRLMTHLMQAAPFTDIIQRPANPFKVEALLQSGQVDLGIGYLSDPPPALRTRSLLKDSHVCLARSQHPILRHRTLEEFAAAAHVTVSPGGAGLLTQRIDDALLAAGVRRRIATTLPSFLAVPYVVEQSDLIAIVPMRIASHFARHLDLRVFDPPIRIPGVEFSLFWHERSQSDLANAWLRSTIIKLMKGL